MKASTTIEEYITTFEPANQQRLRQMHNTIKAVVPAEATEKISYGIPTFTLGGKNLVHFGGYDKHIGFYPGSQPIEVFKKELEPYETSRGTVRFPIDKPLPLDLVRNITTFCVQRNKQ